jgi:hypothetical protein
VCLPVQTAISKIRYTLVQKSFFRSLNLRGLANEDRSFLDSYNEYLASLIYRLMIVANPLIGGDMNNRINLRCGARVFLIPAPVLNISRFHSNHLIF